MKPNPQRIAVPESEMALAMVDTIVKLFTMWGDWPPEVHQPENTFEGVRGALMAALDTTIAQEVKWRSNGGAVMRQPHWRKRP